ncbi:hypothetical protein DEU56DRAFT_917672 [Suillus clintonianus]|uniref:uncharacterized protein n=1 Tax=Suillus clintonianus TaxID=1904413 RepID=UPI001B87CC9B|nr:uncharacterized protein DEU56DRAFT_917672 [Suillus clintonianus]KAG2122776.1 hypothetical protein DEU56DRAFT_917672 [Suillus clintonianus]
MHHTSALHLSRDASPEVLIKMKYAYVALVALWVYDYVTTLDEELPFIARSSWRIVKYLYLVCRYVPFIYLAVVLIRTLENYPSLDMCQTYYSLNSYLGTVIILSAESIFFVRTYAIWDRSKRVLWVFIISVIFLLTPIVAILVKYNSSTTVTSSIAIGISGCSKTGETTAVLFVYVLMVIAELEILCLTLYRAIGNCRREHGRANVLKVLVQHNVFYFLCGVVSSLVLIVAIAILPASYSDLASSIQITAHAALVTRMHRALWRYNENHARSDEFSLTTFSAASIPPFRTLHSSTCIPVFISASSDFVERVRCNEGKSKVPSEDVAADMEVLGGGFPCPDRVLVSVIAVLVHAPMTDHTLQLIKSWCGGNAIPNV